MDNRLCIKNFKIAEVNPLDLNFLQFLYAINRFISQNNSNSSLTVYRRLLEKLNSNHWNKYYKKKILKELFKQIKKSIVISPLDQNHSFVRPHPLSDFDYPLELTVQKNCIEIPALGENFGFPSEATTLVIPHELIIKYFETFGDRKNLYLPHKKTCQRSNHTLRSITNEDYSRQRSTENLPLLDVTCACFASIQFHCIGAGDAFVQHKKSKMVDKQGKDLKNSYNEIFTEKVILKNTNILPEDWKNTIATLQIQLTETLGYNDELKRNVKDIEPTSEINDKEECENETQNGSDLYAKEIEELKIVNEEEVKKLENSFEIESNELHSDYQLKMDEIKSNYEMQLEELYKQNNNETQAKNQEITRLSEIIQEQCTNMSNEIAELRKHVETLILNNGYEEKVVLLQKCVSKMDKLYQKSEEEYLTRIEKLKEDMELKDEIQLVQMETQRTQSTIPCNAEKQQQIDDIINNLEVKYIQMLESYEKQVADAKKSDEERIEYLKYLLEQNKIPFKKF